MTDFSTSKKNPLARCFEFLSCPERDAKPLSRPGWWLVFVLATWAMANCFETFRQFTKIPDAPNAFFWVSSFFLLTPPLLLLIYDSYVQEKNRGRIEKPFRLLEWMMRRRFLLGSAFKPEETKS